VQAEQWKWHGRDVNSTA